LGREIVERANDVASQGVVPDLTLLLDAPVEVGLGRRAGAGDANHFDSETTAFHERVREGFLSQARDARERWVVIDASRGVEDVVAEAVAAVDRVVV
jgi:dTMP kinase